MCGEMDENKEPSIKISCFSESVDRNLNLSMIYLVL